MAFFAQRVEAAAHARAIAVLTEQAADSSELSSAFNRFSTQKVQSVIVPANGLFRTQSQQIAQLALDSRLPTISSERGYVEAGLLASYGVNVAEGWSRSTLTIRPVWTHCPVSYATGRYPKSTSAAFGEARFAST